MQDLGRRYDDPTLVALGVYFEGRVRIKQARVADGLALLDEAMVAALSDELGPAVDRRDLLRPDGRVQRAPRPAPGRPSGPRRPGAGATRCRWRRSTRASAGCTGRRCCRSAESGSRPRTEALGACEDMVGIDVFAVADAYYEVGEVRRLRGDLAGAEQAYAHAHELRPRPAAGPRAAAARAGHASTRRRVDRRRARGRRRQPPGAGALHVGAGARSLWPPATSTLAEASAQEVADTAETFDSAGLRAEGHRCRGAVLLAQGRTVEAIGAAAARRSTPGRRSTCRTRPLAPGCCWPRRYRALGDADAAAREQAAAQACFDRLGVTRPRAAGLRPA